jgi:hypothetical protein
MEKICDGKSKRLEDLSPEERRNLVGFFSLLVKVDKRVNPSLYIKKQSHIQKNDRHNKSADSNE